MMEMFNALQLVCLFAAMPFIITFVKDAEFYAHSTLFWVLIAGYTVGFFGLVGIVADKMDRK